MLYYAIFVDCLGVEEDLLSYLLTLMITGIQTSQVCKTVLHCWKVQERKYVEMGCHVDTGYAWILSFEPFQLLLATTFSIECMEFKHLLSSCYFEFTLLVQKKTLEFTFVYLLYLCHRFSAEEVKRKREDLGDVCALHILLEICQSYLIFFRFFLRHHSEAQCHMKLTFSSVSAVVYGFCCIH